MKVGLLPRPLIALMAAAALLALGIATALPTRAGSATHAVAIADFAFAPGTLTIRVGDTVTWTNNDSVVHTATSTSGAFDSGDLQPGASYSMTFTAPGTFDYRCTPHPFMTGRIVVEPAAAAPTAAPAAPTPAPSTPAGNPLPDVAMQPRAPFALLLAGSGLLVIAASLGVVTRRSRR